MSHKTNIDDYKDKVEELELAMSTQKKEQSQKLAKREATLRKVSLEVKKLEHELIDSKIETAFLKQSLEEYQHKLQRERKLNKNGGGEQQVKKFQSKFLETFDKDEALDNAKMVKLDEKKNIPNPSAKIENTRSMNYAEKMLGFNDYSKKSADKKQEEKKEMLKQKQFEEIQIHKHEEEDQN